jgi:hypothetical protein
VARLDRIQDKSHERSTKVQNEREKVISGEMYLALNLVSLQKERGAGAVVLRYLADGADDPRKGLELTITPWSVLQS